jgi:periplasmic copper chaperone A
MRRYALPLAAASALTAASIIAAFAGPHHAHPPANAPQFRTVHHVDPAKSDGMVVVGDIEIAHGWVRAMLDGQPAGGGYLTLTNRGTEADRLVSATAEDARTVEIHMMEMKNDVMVMRPVDGGLEIGPGETVELKPGGLHLMFMGVEKPFAEGQSVNATLVFEKAGSIDVALPVRRLEGGHGHHH